MISTSLRSPTLFLMVLCLTNMATVVCNKRAKSTEFEDLGTEQGDILTCVHPSMASLGPMRRSPRVAPAACEKAVLNVSRPTESGLRRKPLCGLASDQNLPFLNKHLVVLDRVMFARVARAHGWAVTVWSGRPDVGLWKSANRRLDFKLFSRESNCKTTERGGVLSGCFRRGQI